MLYTSFLEDLLSHPISNIYLSHLWDLWFASKLFYWPYSKTVADWIRLWNNIQCLGIIYRKHTILCCNTDRERQYKILHRLHCTPWLRYRLGLNSSICVKGNSEIGTYAHMFWKCTKIQIFWREVRDEVASLIGYDCQLLPLQSILAAKVDSARNNANIKLTGIHLYAARKNISTLDDWYKEVLRILPLEKSTYTIHDNVNGFINYSWINNNCVLAVKVV